MKDMPATREWLLDAADLECAAKHAETEVNAINERLNELHMNMASSLVARALIAGGVLRIAGDWLSDATGMQRELARATIKNIAEELPPGLVGDSYINPELV